MRAGRDRTRLVHGPASPGPAVRQERVLVERSGPFDGRPRSSEPRALTRLSPEESARYTMLVAGVAEVVEAGLSAAVSANRLAGFDRDPPSLRFVPWRVERAAFVGRLAAMARSHRCLVFADVRDCYGSIRPAVVRSALAGLHAEDEACDAVEGFLDGLVRRGVRGLPVGPSPSPVLANAVLTAADRALERWRVPHLRWVDDIVVGTSERGGAERIVAGLAAVLEQVGLELNESKTHIVVDPAGELTAPMSVAEGAMPVG